MVFKKRCRETFYTLLLKYLGLLVLDTGANGSTQSHTDTQSQGEQAAKILNVIRL